MPKLRHRAWARRTRAAQPNHRGLLPEALAVAGGTAARDLPFADAAKDLPFAAAGGVLQASRRGPLPRVLVGVAGHRPRLLGAAHCHGYNGDARARLTVLEVAFHQKPMHHRLPAAVPVVRKAPYCLRAATPLAALTHKSFHRYHYCRGAHSGQPSGDDVPPCAKVYPRVLEAWPPPNSAAQQPQRRQPWPRRLQIRKHLQQR